MSKLFSSVLTKNTSSAPKPLSFDVRFDLAIAACAQVARELSLDLGGVKHSAALSEETQAFKGFLRMKGRRIAVVENSGRGASTLVCPVSVGARVGEVSLVEESLRAAIELNPDAINVKIDSLVDYLLEEYLKVKQMRADCLGGHVCWFGPIVDGEQVVNKVRWPEIHALWKINAAQARSIFVTYGIERGMFETVQFFHNDALWGVE